MIKKAIICDLDGTLTESKSELKQPMADTICAVLATRVFAVISGGDWPQFQKQFLGHMSCLPEALANLILFPTSGAECYRWNTEHMEWRQAYDEQLTTEEKRKIMKAYEEALPASGVSMGEAYGEWLEDRGEQITFSGCGQQAPLMIKAAWDPDQAKRKKIIAELVTRIPEFEITIGGATSIDITRKGIHKAYAIQKLEEILGISKEEILFIGDALYAGGNDEKAKQAGVECLQVSGPDETREILESFAQP